VIPVVVSVAAVIPVIAAVRIADGRSDHHRGRGDHDGGGAINRRGHIHGRGWRSINHGRRCIDRGRSGNDYARERNPEAETEMHPGLRGRHGAEDEGCDQD
jgi:hypothetical protein